MIPNLSRFLSPDTIIPSVGNSQAWDRFAYALNSPIRFVDPTGHTSACAYNNSDSECSRNAPKKYRTFDDRFGLTFTGDGWTAKTRGQVRQAAFDIGMALAKKQSGSSFSQAFAQVYKSVTVEWDEKDDRMRTPEQNANPACKDNFAPPCDAGGGFTVSSSYIVFASLSIDFGVKNAVHEFGHAYSQAAGGINTPNQYVKKRDDILRPLID